MDEFRRYELWVIFQPELEEDQLEARLDRVSGYLTGIGGDIVEVARKGKRRLAYAIDRHNQGIDVIYQANLPGPRLETLERQLNLNEDVIRYLLVRREDLEKEARKAGEMPAAVSAPSLPGADETPTEDTSGGEASATDTSVTETPVVETAADATPVGTEAPEVETSAAGTVSPVGEADETAVGLPADDAGATDAGESAPLADVAGTTEA
ncbi:MAG TPA: 30S ribosomal protein S6 [Ardenticatenaceae bacterium]|jgi:small subunit ribosomal protein S6